MIALVSLLSLCVRSRASLEFELIAPRHQLIGFRIYWRQQARNLVADMRVSPRDYKLDHIVPLDLWGRPACLMLQPWAGACNAHMKDDLERQLSIMVPRWLPSRLGRSTPQAGVSLLKTVNYQAH